MITSITLTSSIKPLSYSPIPLVFWIGLLLLFLGLSPTQAQQSNDQIVLLDHLARVDARKGALVYYDTTKSMSIGEVVIEDGFRPVTLNDRFFLEYKSGSVLWIKLRLQNASSQRIFLIDVPNATIDDLRFYSIRPDRGFDMQQVGDAFPHHQRMVASLGFTFQANIPTGEIHDYYLRVDGRGDAISTDVFIWQPVSYLNETANSKYVFGLYYGMLLFIVIFHFFLYVRLNDRSLVYYMLYIVGFAGVQMGLDGFTSIYFFPNSPWLANRLVPACIYLASGALVGFFQYFHNTKQHLPKTHKYLSFVQYFSMSLTVLCFLGHDLYLIMIQLSGVYGLLSLVLVLLMAVRIFKYEPILAKYFISAFIFLVLGVVIGIMRTRGFHIPGSEYGMKLGAATEIIVLAFALAEKFKLMEEEANKKAVKSLEDLNEFQKRYNQDLKKEVDYKTAVLEKSTQNIKDSIRYAKRIQSSLLPSRDLLDKTLKSYFLYYQPRDIVSGDFYWFGRSGTSVVMAVIDCTGHGVPGAFMSILGINALHEIVTVRKLNNPSYILMAMNEYIRESLRQDNTESLTSDGMDAAVVCYDLVSQEIEFAGAKRPLIYFKDGNMELVKGSKYAIGGKTIKEKVFDTHRFQKGEIDSLYLFTDGYIDQFGGPSDRKFMIRRFKEMLCEIHTKPMQEQRKVIDRRYQEWKGHQRQIDDILVVGLQFDHNYQLRS